MAGRWHPLLFAAIAVALPASLRAQLNVISSGGYMAPFREVLPELGKTTGITVTTTQEWEKWVSLN